MFLWGFLLFSVFDFVLFWFGLVLKCALSRSLVWDQLTSTYLESRHSRISIFNTWISGWYPKGCSSSNSLAHSAQHEGLQTLHQTTWKVRNNIQACPLMSTRTVACTHACMFTCAHTYVHTHTCNTHTGTHTYMHACTCTHTHAHKPPVVKFLCQSATLCKSGSEN